MKRNGVIATTKRLYLESERIKTHVAEVAKIELHRVRWSKHGKHAAHA